MNPIKKENTPAAVLVLELLRKRLQHRYEEAASRQSVGGRPSGHMNGLNEAIKEVDNLILERAGWQSSSPPFRLSVMESQTTIGNGVTLQVWFTRAGADNIRSELYCLEDGSVVAYQDCVNGVNEPLHMESMFRSLYEDEPAFGAILHYSGVMNPNKIEMYHMGG